MSVTRKEIRQAVGYALRDMVAGTFSEVSTGGFTDYDRIDSNASDSKYSNAWIYIVSGTRSGTQRRIATYAPTTGVFTVSRAWDLPAPGDEYEIHLILEPEEINRLISEALVTLPYEVSEELTYVEDQAEYDLSSYTWLTDWNQIVDLRWRYGETANEYRYYPVPYWRVRDIDGVLTLCVPPGHVEGDLLMTAQRYYDALESDTDSTDCPLDWVQQAVIVGAYALLSRQAPAKDANRYDDKWSREMSVLQLKHRKYAPRPRLFVHSPGAV